MRNIDFVMFKVGKESFRIEIEYLRVTDDEIVLQVATLDDAFKVCYAYRNAKGSQIVPFGEVFQVRVRKGE